MCFFSYNTASVTEVMSNDNDMKIGFGDDVDIEYQVEAKDLPLLAIDSLFSSESEDDDVIGAVILDISDSESEDVRVYGESDIVPGCCNFETLSGRECRNTFFLCNIKILEYPNKDLHWNNPKDGNALLSVNHECSIMLAMNIHSFQPFDGVSCPCSAIYLCINNLPTPERYNKGEYCLRWSHSRTQGISILCYFLWCSYSCCLEKLFDPIYFHLVECTVIDPMHNLYIGTAKRVMAKWRSSGLITDAHLAATRVDAENVLLSEYYTSLGTRIGRGFPFMKANEWKECEVLYQAPFGSPKMHLHLRLRESVLSFGLVYRSWLFGLERCNGFSKDYMTNRRDGFETMYMKKCLEDTYQEDFIRQTLLVIQSGHSAIILELTTSTAAAILSHINAVLGSHEIKFVIVKVNEPLLPSALPLALKGEISMEESEYEHLSSIITSQIYRSKTRNQRGSFMQALFETSDGRSTKPYVDQIQYFFVNTAVNLFASYLSQHVFACVRWYKEIMLQPRAGEGVEVKEVGFKDAIMNSILPAFRICYPVVHYSGKVTAKFLGMHASFSSWMCVNKLFAQKKCSDLSFSR
ncbi:hypothetical protein PHYBLDRAFT_70687 [Phycomyces blakesleeanus NRRL 1555(-)]|uniref:Uncharacterized protein n=1 Tax=Phycomyces blakesleeanus (strain ATCC 8743b / DSM 1359 / FGSC 10004 / NBRC 33097 / NRRL 1555) TaxID=763407 RepID=A0A162PMQ1_PHYB8|nr:hypothetical protein PHYBLDRAFT_70687 [Phycomyces blakesleeanus NRRL 1555(-)]OAD70396.1 hypothetical protein PHYBLDRAFT_70687 [Phycomyces blakesleeanus NRRL 1555(-)]|eukprot:XP_018288436.1 hypothetical protein PHYBLDRAFT_70687 [Phycomyces blakesleeanus NRRL 1555(-)]